MSLSLSVLMVGIGVFQAPPLSSETDRGPYGATLLLEQAIRREAPHMNSTLLARYERWEFWFEHERDFLLRGRPEHPPTAVDEAGRFGPRSWHLEEDTLRAQALPWLHKAMRSERAAEREAAALSLGRIGDPSGVAYLLEATRDAVAEVRQAAWIGLGWIGEGRALTHLVANFLDHPDPIDRAFAAVGLGLSGRAEASHFLRRYLDQSLQPEALVASEEPVLQAAVWACGWLGQAKTAAALMSGYERLEPLDQARSIRLRALILQSLGKIGEPRARPLLERALRSSHPYTSRAAAQAMGWLGDPKALEALKRTYAEHPNAETRQLALIAIGRLGGPAAIEVLRGAREGLSRNPIAYGYWALACGLAQAGECIPILRTELLWAPFDPEQVETRSPELWQPPTRRDQQSLRAAMALGWAWIGDAAAVPSLRRLLEQEGMSPELRGKLLLALGRIGGPEASRVLLAEAEEGAAPSARRDHATALALVGTDAAATVLARWVTTDPDTTVRGRAARGLALNRTRGALEVLIGALEGEPAALDADAVPQVLLALGYLGDRRHGASLGAWVSGLDYRQQFPLLDALRGY